MQNAWRYTTWLSGASYMFQDYYVTLNAARCHFSYMVHLQPTPTTSCLILQQYYGLLWNAILLILMYNTLWITQSPFIETTTPPPIAPAHGWICSAYLLLLYTRYYSNPTAVLCTGNITMFARKEHNHGLPDFPVQQFSYFLLRSIFCFLPGIFYFLVVVKHSTLFIYLVYQYIIPYVLEYYNFIHNWYIYTWYTRTAVYVVPWYHTTYVHCQIFAGIYLVRVRQTYYW